MNFAVLASGNGSNLQAIIDALKDGRIHGTLTAVISDKAEARALERARQAGVAHVDFVNPKEFSTRSAFDEELIARLRRYDVKLIVLAGYMRILSPAFVQAFPNRIINIHPALLPAFKGAHALRDALAAGVKTTGVTVHYVDEEVDHGPIIAQVPVEILPGDTLDTLTDRVHRAEHQLYPAIIDRLLNSGTHT